MRDDLRPIRRYYRTSGEKWAEISHLYRFRAREIAFGERIRMLRESRRSPLVAGEAPGMDTNRYGSLKNVSPLSLVRMARNLMRSTGAYTFDGPTDELMTEPWVLHLRRLGVVFRMSMPVDGIRSRLSGVTVQAGGVSADADAVVVTAFVPDLVKLLDASGLAHRVPQHPQTHCASFTLGLDRREQVLAGNRPALFCHRGINMLIQPGRARCLVLCVRSRSTQPEFVLRRVQELLGLDHDLTYVRMRLNHRPEEGVHTAEQVDPRRILVTPVPRLYFAGSFLRQSYPFDSGEAAAQSAFHAVQAIRRDLGLPACTSAVRGAVKGSLVDS